MEKSLQELGISIEDATITLNGKPDYVLDSDSLVHTDGEPENPNTYEDTAWHAHWTNLPKFDKEGREITYHATETIYKINGKVFDITADGLIPAHEEDTENNTFAVTNGIPPKEISAKKRFNVPYNEVPASAKVTLQLSASINGVPIEDLSVLGVTNPTVVLDGKVTQDDPDEVETPETLWSYTWSDMLWYYQNVEIDYRVTEIAYEVDGITYSTADPDSTPLTGYDFSFTNKLPTVEVDALKTWKNNAGETINDEIENVEVSFELWSKASSTAQWKKVLVDADNNEITNPITISVEDADEDAWKAVWNNLPKYNNLERIQYRVEETRVLIETDKDGGTALTPPSAAHVVFPEGQGQDTGTANITNTLPVTDITVHKTWGVVGVWPDLHISVEMTLKEVDENGDVINLPDHIVHYTKPEEGEPQPTTPYATVTLTDIQDKGWLRLPKYRDDGSLIDYTVVETGVIYTPNTGDPIRIENIEDFFDVTTTSDDGNTQSQGVTGTGFTIDNKPKETEIKVTKVWTENDVPRTDKQSVDFQLFRTGNTRPITMTAENMTTDKGTPEPGKIYYVEAGDSTPAGWQVVTIKGLDMFELQYTEPTDTDPASVTYVPVRYYVQETGDTGNTQVTYAGTESATDGGTPVTSEESAVPSDVTTSAGTITIYNRDAQVTVNLLKIDEATRQSAEPTVLSGAVFQLMKYNALLAPTSSNPYVNVGDEVPTDANGELAFSELGVGKYKLVEKVPPVGYVKTDNEDVYFMVNSDGTVSWTDSDYHVITSQPRVTYDDAANAFTIGNLPGAALPNSGGSGTSLFYILGTMLLAFAATGFFIRRRL